MINGTADPQDPPSNMTGTRSLWPDSRLLARTRPGSRHRFRSLAAV